MSDYQLYLGDCLEYMKTMPDKSVDAVITSPPYDNLRMYGGNEFHYAPIIDELYRTIKEGGIVVWIVGDQTIGGSESGTSFRQALYFIDFGFNLHDTMIYEKNGASFPAQDKYYQTFEYMFILSKGKPKTVNLLRDRKNIWGIPWGNNSKRDINGNLVISERYDTDDIGVRFNVWRYNTGKGFTTKDEYAYKHPAMFPEKLAQDHILSWTNPYDWVMDPMMGSGTTGKMAILNGRNFIGCEIDENYFKIAEKRIKQAAMQMLLPIDENKS